MAKGKGKGNSNSNNNNNNREGLEYKLAEVEAKIEGLEEYTKSERARKLVSVVKRSGAYKGEVTDLTPKQYRTLMGKPARKAIINRKGKVPWEYSFDELATELGYSSDETLKKAVEDQVKKRHQLENLKAQSSRLQEELRTMPKEVAKEKKLRKVALKFDKRRIEVDGKVTAYQITAGKEIVGYLVAFPPSYGVYESANGLNIRQRPVGGAKSVKKAKEIAKKQLRG